MSPMVESRCVNAAADLPVTAVFGELRAALAGARAALLVAPPGSGKTTAVPPALLDADWLRGRRIVMLEPRRLAARAAAERIAWMLGEPLGRRVGYRVRFESVGGADVRIEVVTEGVLLRRLQRDPVLEDVGLLIFDEFHERSLEADTSLALVLDARRAFETDLRVLVMSATLDAAPVARLLGAATPLLETHGRSFPVDVRYLDRMPAGRTDAALAAGIRRALAEHEGDVLAFAPGAAEIRACVERLADLAAAGVLLQPLSRDLPRAAQDAAIAPHPEGRRRVVVATNIAETSLTIEGVGVVVDSGLARVPCFDPGSGLERLRTVRISMASATQRAGRAGRLGPGVCLRLWTESVQQGLAEHAPPAIASADLAPLLLELAAWGCRDPGQLDWLTPPPAGACAAARDLLIELGALDATGAISAVGRAMASLPVHPRLARMLLAARDDMERALACDVAALLSERDPLRRADAGVDVGARLACLRDWRERRRRGGDSSLARIDRVARQLAQLLASAKPPPVTAPGLPALDAGALLSLAYPDRIALRRARGRAADDVRYRLAGGRAARLAGEDALARERLLVVASLDADAADARAWLAAALDDDALRRLHGERIHSRENIDWDEREQAVRARREERLGALLLSHCALAAADPDAVLAAMLEGVRRMGLGCLPWSAAAEGLRARVRFLRALPRGVDLPDLADETLLAGIEDWLAPWLAGLSRREHLARLDMLAVLQTLLGREALRRVDEGAPTHLRVPSGSRLALDYRAGERPLLEVRVQEMFGCAETPRVGWGEVPVMLHLLSPARRPVQVTDDLAGFWRGSYAEVRREMRGRYPKHPWPEDPLHAAATRRAKPRR